MKLLKIQTVTANFNFLPNKLNFCCGNYSREETTRGYTDLPCDLITNYLYKKSKLLGWGKTDPAVNDTATILGHPILQAVDVKVIDNKRCEDWHREQGLIQVCPFNYFNFFDHELVVKVTSIALRSLVKHFANSFYLPYTRHYNPLLI